MNFLRKNLIVVLAVFLIAIVSVIVIGKEYNTLERAEVQNAVVSPSPIAYNETKENEIIPEEIPVPAEEVKPSPKAEQALKDSVTQEAIPKESPVQKKAEEVQKQLTCTLSVTCDAVLQNMDRLNPDKIQIIPENGIIFAMQTVSFEEGESVFDVLVRELRKNKIHLEFEETPGLGSAYIEGIGNIYEFDLGDMSGWTYTVNGESPSVGCSDCLVKKGDIIKFEYVCY